jgi:hypothetical protein
MEAKELDRLEQLEKAATEGPWENRPVSCNCGDCGDVSNIVAPLQGFPRNTVLDGGAFTNSPTSVEDGNFIVALRNAAPALISEARAAARMRKAATALLAYFDRCGAPAYEHMEALRASLGGEGGNKE